MPQAWALHPYGDMTTASTSPSSAFPATRNFGTMTGTAPLWLTEVGSKLFDGANYYPTNGNASSKYMYGVRLRERMGTNTTRAIMYHLTPGAGGWDSALTDRAGRARDGLCGLAGLTADLCIGNPAAHGP